MDLDYAKDTVELAFGGRLTAPVDWIIHLMVLTCPSLVTLPLEKGNGDSTESRNDQRLVSYASVPPPSTGKNEGAQ